MKVFKKLDGNKFNFKKGELVINYTRIFKSDIENTRKIVKKIEYKYIILDNIITPNSLNKLAISKDFSYINKTLLNSLEYAGQLLEIDETRIYSINYYNYLLKKELEKHQTFSKKYIANMIKNRKYRIKNKTAILKYFHEQLSVKKRKE